MQKPKAIAADNPKPSKGLSTLADLIPDPENPRDIQKANATGLGVALAEYGDLGGITFNTRTGVLVTGHQRVALLSKALGSSAGLRRDAEGRIYIDANDGERFYVREVKWDKGKQKGANFTANNPSIAGHFTPAAQTQLAETREKLGKMFDALRLNRLEILKPKSGKGDPDAVLELPKKAETKQGDLYLLGSHRLYCGSSTSEKDTAALLGSHKPLLLVADPPYCSGGFQEAGRSAGTFGDIAADNLSTRGFVSLLTRALENYRPQASYLFTDWRMWTPLYDLIEDQGLAIRNMIVWAKDTPGLGGLWRTQHELIQFATRGTNKREKGEAASGNVLHAKRTGNKLHYTEKPVDLLAQILANDAKCERGQCPVVDAFAGSGTTLIAAESTGRPCFAMEIEPKFVDVTVARWEAFTGKKAERKRG